MPTAYLMIRPEPHYRRGSFEQGLRACGYTIAGPPRQRPEPGDLLVTWNRYGQTHALATRWTDEGGVLIVAENGLLGRDRGGQHWYSLALNAPAAGGGIVPEALPGENRAATIGAETGEWHQSGREVIVLGQRGIGPPGIASPDRWAETALERVHRTSSLPARIRVHPGERPATPLEEDLKDAWCVVTWSSGAAIRALALGVPVFYQLHAWIARRGAKYWSGERDELSRPLRDDRARAEALDKVGRSTWRTDEIETGEPFRRLVARAQTSLERSRYTRSAATTAPS